MEVNKIREWDKALETAELSPITANLPKTAAPGDVYEEQSTDGIFRKWVYVEVVFGNPGARWAYWHNAKEFKVVVDAIFNGDAAHFLGMLGTPHHGTVKGTSSFAWVMTSPKVEPPREIRIIDERKGERYERSKEVFDVNTQKSTFLP